MYEQLLPDTDVKNGNIEFVAPAEPGDGEEERKISLDVLETDYFAPIVRDKIPDPDQRIELDIAAPMMETPDD